jgi:HSP20 family molecular chaperone IbpA
VTIIEGNMLGGEHFERVEYVITAEMPKRLEKTILVETNGVSIHLHSTSDKEFRRSYPIPEGHELEGLDYDYDEGYLVLRLHLVRIP